MELRSSEFNLDKLGCWACITSAQATKQKIIKAVLQKLNAFVQGVTAAATGAIAGAVVVLARRSVYDLPTILICLLSFAILFRWKVPEPLLIASAAVAGLLLRMACEAAIRFTDRAQ
jgi:chromate transport protein ChrA